jgi:hypothetical protein
MKGMPMRKQYDQNVALSLINRMKNGEKINDLSKETGVPRTTLWRWKKGISFPASGISKNYPEYYRKNKKEIIERIKKEPLRRQVFWHSQKRRISLCGL